MKPSDDLPATGDHRADIEPPPKPTYVPAAMAMGIMMAFWGILTHWTMSLGGSLLVVWALWTWMNEIHQAWKSP